MKYVHSIIGVYLLINSLFASTRFIHVYNIVDIKCIVKCLVNIFTVIDALGFTEVKHFIGAD